MTACPGAGTSRPACSADAGRPYRAGFTTRSTGHVNLEVASGRCKVNKVRRGKDASASSSLPTLAAASRRSTRTSNSAPSWRATRWEAGSICPSPPLSAPAALAALLTATALLTLAQDKESCVIVVCEVFDLKHKLTAGLTLLSEDVTAR